MQKVEKLTDLASRTKNHRMRLRLLVSKRIEKTTACHSETAPIAIRSMQSSDVLQSIFHHEIDLLDPQSGAPENLASQSDSRCPGKAYEFPEDGGKAGQ
jgi:hypothetical protein